MIQEDLINSLRMKENVKMVSQVRIIKYLSVKDILMYLYTKTYQSHFGGIKYRIKGILQKQRFKGNFALPANIISKFEML